MQEPELEEDALTAEVENGTLRIERRSTEDAPPGEVTVTDPDGKTQKLPLISVSPGRSRASLPAGSPGVWQVSSGGKTAYGAATAANPPEFDDLRATATKLGKLIRASGGGVHWLEDGSEAGHVPMLVRTEPDRDASGAGWIGIQRRRDHLVTGIAALPLLPTWLALPLMLGLAIAAWRREGA